MSFDAYCIHYRQYYDFKKEYAFIKNCSTLICVEYGQAHPESFGATGF